MAQRKVYRSLVYKDLDTYIVIDGVKTLIQFRGGSLQPPINGIYVTQDPKVIKAMDSDRGNGTSFICIASEGEEGPEEDVKAEVKKEKPQVFDQPQMKQVPGIFTIQDVKEYLLKNIDGLKPVQMPNAKSVENMAAKHGLVFPDLKL